ncbi:hypothetical protein MBBAR_28c00230 [Methanobrevibacter arboriphilus JCM 13429 = DSM 1125]|uniref:Uncharacterized protein n=1 Tax=Methanobrevibacter arboriphilus JCM 13429 = DSM 1125 TaxID=1300164 RepID=A0A1V6N0K9_METAZ|nr:hypothetical protein [Methanobrevibacter arboriphilus]OQD58137.1 hypothetical protein MBBAR_28c00230 [Methanobrevibacter arboriphilus JCM 13429 = DSM 1125]
MIEDKIQVLRKAAKVSNEQSSDKLWCVAAGNEELVNNIAYTAIASKDRVKILFREHITLEESYVHKKFDFIMLYGDSDKIRELSYVCKENGGAYIQIAPFYVGNEPNLTLLVAPDDALKKLVGDAERNNSQFSILLEDQTTGFIETDLHLRINLPNFLQTMLAPLFNMSDVVLSTILISIENEEDIGKIRKIADKNNVFLIDFKDIVENK